MMGNGQVAGISQTADTTVSEVPEGLLRCLGVELVMAFLEAVQGLLPRFVCVYLLKATGTVFYLFKGPASELILRKC